MHQMSIQWAYIVNSWLLESDTLDIHVHFVTFLNHVWFSISKAMKSILNFNFVYLIVLFNDRRTHIPSLVMMLKLGKMISVENQSVRF